MHLRRNIIFSAIGMLLVVCVLVVIYLFEYVRIEYAAIDYITELQKGPNNFLDLQNDIDVDSAEDLGFEQKSDYDLVLHYGKQIIKINKQCLESEQWRNKMDRIGIKVYSRVNEETKKREYRITYWGEDIEQWSLVD